MIGRFQHVFGRLTERRLLRDTFATTVWGIVGKAVGFLLPIVIGIWYGVTPETDAFFFAYALLLFLAGSFGPVLSGVIVPFIAEAREGGEDVGQLVGRLLGTAIWGFAGITVIFLGAMYPLMPYITDFDGPIRALAYRLLLETSPFVLLVVLCGILEGTLNAYRHFGLAAVSPVVRGMGALALIVMFQEALGIHAIPLGYVVGEAMRFALLLTGIYRAKILTLRLAWTVDKKLGRFLNTAAYQILGMVAVGFNPMVDRAMASWLEPGSVSLLHYSDRINFIPVAVFTTGVSVTLLSHWSDAYYKQGAEAFHRHVARSAVTLLMITLVAMGALMIARGWLVRLAFGHGAFSEADLEKVTDIWYYYLLGLAPVVLGNILGRAHLVTKRTATLFGLAAGGALVHVVLNLALMGPLGVRGIALSTTLTTGGVALGLSLSLWLEYKREQKND